MSEQLTPVQQNEGCDIAETNGYIRAVVGPALAGVIQDCYRALATACVERHCRRALVIGRSRWDPFYHLAGRDALRSMALAGLPDGFRIAFVADTPGLIAVYDAAVREAERLQIEARRFTAEEDATRWLAA